ncbi:MAG: glutathione S-transferase [Gammaproteobacteria bacterium]|jgi:glutathione S-transferase|nr:glutathione S-transferase [Gammaproteobacteria bacterium]
MITVHHLEDSRSQRVLWLLEELGLDYEIRRYERDPETMLGPESLKQVHPLGKSPVIEDGGRVVAESGAIIEYLVQRHGDGRLAPPAGTDERLRYTYWLHYAEGTLMPLFVMGLVFERLSGPPMPLLLRPVGGLIGAGVRKSFIEPRLGENLAFIEDELGRSTWFAGEELSGADVQMSFPLEAAASRGGVDDYPRIRAFVERVHARPAYRRALERGGPYSYAD